MGDIEVQRLRALGARIVAAGTPLPGLVPYENRRPITVLGRYSGRSALDFLCARFPYLPREHWAKDFRAARFKDERGRLIGANDRVQGGQRLIRLLPNTTEPQVSVDVQVLCDDAEFLAVHKPAPLPVHACGRFNRHTLAHLLALAFPEWQLRNCHRLDADTSGVMLWAKTKSAARDLQSQFEHRVVCKTYLARVHGTPTSARWNSAAQVSRGSVNAGARELAAEGLCASTSFRWLGRFDDNTSLVAAYPKTGRTHQLRLHLAGCGLPIVGDPAYSGDGSVASGLVGSGICLHASELTFTHPNGGLERLRAPVPGWARLAKPCPDQVDVESPLD